ncbi:hypothetical protein KFE25_006249 [Diacronema lutheri]|uniref:Magnesium transporter n=1 Tax=Diacronema lutheri TaxID=2081491 RepID=A0A8J6CEL7_DIALT|nr:hypothetical protein KFE25_006249 [Diacronema lutheri]
MLRHGEVYAGIALAIAAGATTALSMVVQHAALTYPGRAMPARLCGRTLCDVNKNAVWMLGLVLYGVGTGVVYSFAGLWIPLSLLACLFLTMLAFNLFFSWYFLGEALTWPKVAGSLIVLLGACMCAIGASVGNPGVPTDFSSDDVAALFAAPLGATYFALLVLSVLSTLGAILVHERTYPLDRVAERPPPAWLESTMAVMYPASLGLDEAVAHLTLRCMNAMLSQCNRGGCSHPIFPATIVMCAVSSVGTVIWLRIVFKRFAVTSALPIEYGAASAADVASGLLFFQEYKSFALWRYPLIVGGVALCLVGIQVGRMAADKAPASELARAITLATVIDPGKPASPSSRGAHQAAPAAQCVPPVCGDGDGDQCEAGGLAPPCSQEPPACSPQTAAGDAQSSLRAEPGAGRPPLRELRQPTRSRRIAPLGA